MRNSPSLCRHSTIALPFVSTDTRGQPPTSLVVSSSAGDVQLPFTSLDRYTLSVVPSFCIHATAAWPLAIDAERLNDQMLTSPPLDSTNCDVPQVPVVTSYLR